MMPNDSHELRVDGYPASFRHVKAPSHLTHRMPIVLLHGAGCDSRIFDELSIHLDDRELIAIDLPGRRGSLGPPAQTALKAADFVAHCLDALSIERAMVLGHSFGGAVAIELALSAKDKVAGLVLVSTGARLRVHPAILSAMEAAALAGPRSMANLPWLADTDPALVERIDREVTEVPSKTTLADWQAAHAFDRMDRLSEIESPALAVTGTEDALTRPKYARYLAASLKDARLALVEGAGHMLPVEKPLELAAEIRAWLEIAFGQAS